MLQQPVGRRRSHQKPKGRANYFDNCSYFMHYCNSFQFDCNLVIAIWEFVNFIIFENSSILIEMNQIV